MATYYVDFVNGLDANNGLGPDASHATNKPWKTLTKLLGASGMASGDTAYLSPAGPFRETVSVAMTSATAETKVIADPANAQGFKTSGGALVAPGDVTLTAYTTNDTTAPTSTALLVLAGRDFLTFQGITFIGGNGFTVDGSTTTATNVSFLDCTFIQGMQANTASWRATAAADTPLHWLIDRCRFLKGAGTCLALTLTTSASADYDADVLIRNCVVIGNAGTFVSVIATGAAAFKGGGVDVVNCSCVNSANFLQTGTNISTSIPCTATGNFVITGSNVALNANTSGQITENYNVFLTSVAHTNVSDGANSKRDGSVAPLIEIGQSYVSGRMPRPLFTPMSGSPLLGRDASATGAAYDLLNRIRPAGGASTTPAVGALERHDTAAQETTTVDASGSGLVITGPGSQDLKVAVDAAATTVTIKGRYDTTHAATNKPQVQLLANAAIGVSAQTVTMSAAADTWETLTIGPFTPTAKGVVTIRLVSRAAAGGGKAFFDTATVT